VIANRGSLPSYPSLSKTGFNNHLGGAAQSSPNPGSYAKKIGGPFHWFHPSGIIIVGNRWVFPLFINELDFKQLIPVIFKFFRKKLSLKIQHKIRSAPGTEKSIFSNS